MSDYRIEKARRRVSVFVSVGGGQRLDGDVFLQSAVRFRSGPERPVDLVNDADPFLPLAVSGNDLLLIAKSQIIRVEHSTDEADNPGDLDASEVPLEVLLTDGSTVSGTIHLEVRAERPRVLDFLNAYEGRFLLLACGEITCLINCHRIVHVRQAH